ncbi:MAG: prepilin-type N-terminal cleavage/methylation domain-containing protein [Thermoproteota archaeon]
MVKRDGLTLVELIVAILIISIIGIIGATSYSRVVQKGKVRSMILDMTGIAKEFGEHLRATAAFSWPDLWQIRKWNNPMTLTKKPVVGTSYSVGYEQCATGLGYCLSIEVIHGSDDRPIIDAATDEIIAKGIFEQCQETGRGTKCTLQWR